MNMKPQIEPRKTRSDCVLKNLPERMRREIVRWIEMPKTQTCAGGFAHARAELAERGIEISISTLGEFYSWARLGEIRPQAAATAAAQGVKITREGDVLSIRLKMEAGVTLRLEIEPADPVTTQASPIRPGARAKARRK